MLRGSVGTSSFHHCGKCHGLWLDTEEFSRVCRDAEHQSALLGSPIVIAAGPSASPVAIRYRSCPRCPERMNRVNFAKCSGVVVDVCRTHGTWFDRDELNRILLFIQKGGMQKSRAIESDQLERDRQRAANERRGRPPEIVSILTDPYPGEWTGFALHRTFRLATWILDELL